jgi:hypothetical protein
MVGNERADDIYARAYVLASSGRHLDPRTIISALIEEGYPEAAELLESLLIHNDLRQVCRRHWPGARPVTPNNPPWEE